MRVTMQRNETIHSGHQPSRYLVTGESYDLEDRIADLLLASGAARLPHVPAPILGTSMPAAGAGFEDPDGALIRIVGENRNYQNAGHSYSLGVGLTFRLPPIVAAGFIAQGAAVAAE